MRGFGNLLLRLLLTGVPLVAQQPAIEPVLQAELAFARLARQQGIRTAFLTWLQDDAQVFTPRMTSVKAQYGREPGDPGQLVWYPEAMGISGSGDLAWSFGPWTYAAKPGGAVLVHGHFLSVWRKQADRGWKVEADIGVPHTAPEGVIEPFVVTSALQAEPRPVHTVGLAGSLWQKEAELSSKWAALGGLALLAELAPDARVLRTGILPLQTAAAIRKALETDRPGSTWRPARLHTSPSGDLGWACGECAPDERGATASFLRIWTRAAGDWKVLFDVRVPHPSPPR